MRTFFAALVVVSVVVAGNAAANSPPPKPIVTAVEHGGHCPNGECRTVFRITDTTISARGYVARRLKPGERTALLRAIRRLDPAYLRAHPFRGTCPTAYDGTESLYRFRGFAGPVASCTYDLRAVEAVKVTDRLLSSLQRSGR